LTALDGPGRTRLAALVAEGDRRQFADARWRRELSAWMHPSRSGDGLVVGALTAPATRFVVRRFDVGRSVSRKDQILAERSPALVLLATDGDTPREWMAAGQALQRLLLTATAAGLQASYLNQPVQVAALRSRAAELLELPAWPQVVLRLGFPTEQLVPAPRLPAQPRTRRSDSLT
jgi:hypothetical protein